MGARMRAPTGGACAAGAGPHAARPASIVVLLDTYRVSLVGCAHADALLALKVLALGLERGGNRQLGPVELRDVPVPAGGHRGPQGTNQVEGAVVLAGRALDDLLERPVLRRRDTGPARKRGVEGGHPPVVAAAWGLVRPRQRRSEHHRVGAAGNRLGHITAVAHASIGNDL